MSSNRDTIDLPQPRNASGEIRKDGVEVEFGGLSPATAAEIVARTFGIEAVQLNPFRYEVPTVHGRFLVEFDTRWADPDFVSTFTNDLPEEIRKEVTEGISQAAGVILSGVFPVEVVCPPIAYNELGILRPLTASLADTGALGTSHSVLTGFGMHFNVEVAALTVEHLLAVTRAYLLLDFWLRRESRLALIRHLQYYIQPFPEAYKRHVLSSKYAPDLQAFMQDYMQFNPTRNMELDLLPIFAFVDSGCVDAALPGIKNSPRPTFH